jgi:uracil-DNA glycosylase
MTKEKSQYLKTMGIQPWRLRKGQAAASKNNSCPTVSTSVATTDDWQALEKEVLSCTLCALHEGRNNVVFGVGNRNAKLMFIGEAPGANEDLQGEPFVGRGGMLLNSMLNAIGLKREEVYIANILKCRPPNNRDPLPSEVQICTPYLKRQIAAIKPKLLVAVGRIAAQFLLNTKDSMASLRGKHYSYGENNTPLLVTYHPAYLLRSPREKSKAYIDLLLIKKMLENLN